MSGTEYAVTDADMNRFRARVDETDTCWIWQGSLDADGYGRFSLRGRAFQAHRISYTAAHGSIPEGLVIDHLCRNRACVRPDHLEPVTNAVNILRGVSFSAVNASKEFCDNGHPFDAINTYMAPGGWRRCRACHKASDDRYQERKREARQAEPKAADRPISHGWWRYRQGCRCDECRAANTEHSRAVRANKRAREQP